MAETKGMAELKTNYPLTDGLTAGTTKQTGHKEQLDPEKSFIRQIDKVGIY